MNVATAGTGTLTHRILVVDDDPGMHALCAALLENEGYVVTGAENGHEGLIRAALDRPDLIVCDVAMPVLDGFGFAVALRANSETRDIPLVFLTGETEPEVAAHALRVGALECFAKPLVPGVLSTFIADALATVDRGRVAPPGAVLT